MNFKKIFKSYGYFSAIGKRKRQEDSYFISKRNGENQIFFVADGVGGHDDGDIASKLCVEIFSELFYSKEDFFDIPGFIKKGIINVGEQLLKDHNMDSSLFSSGTTISGFFVKGDSYYVFNVGDSRVYRYNSGKLDRLTKDHSKVQELVDKLIISEDDAYNHPEKNIITSAIGQPIFEIKIDIKGPFEFIKNDILISCTDGIHDYMKDSEISEVIKKSKKKSNISKVLVDQALKSGSSDNLTCCHYKYINN